MTLDSSARTTSNAPSSNKITPQIKIRKPPHRKTSPVNWFPRKKVDSYLNRKIKMLQVLFTNYINTFHLIFYDQGRVN